LISTLVIYLLGDISAQNIAGAEDEPYDPWRTVRALIIGGLAAIPGYNWFVYLAKNFNYASKTLSVAVKVMVNQVMFAPIFNTYFFGMQSLLTGGGWTDIVERVKHTLPRSLVNSWKLWPAVTAFSFAFVPLQFRSLFAGKSCTGRRSAKLTDAGVIAIGWQTYLSILNQKAAAAEAEAEKELEPS
jgi:protein Mpv17